MSPRKRTTRSSNSGGPGRRKSGTASTEGGGGKSGKRSRPGSSRANPAYRKPGSKPDRKTTSTQSLVDNAESESAGVRLQKVLAQAGYGSRRHCEEFIEAGRVTVDGRLVQDVGIKVDIASQDVRVDDERIRPEPKRYYVLNKPPGYVCTNDDPERRPRAMDLFPPDGPRLFSVGRLDENSQGLLIVTNDGELANRLAHPRYRVPRKYRVQVAGKPTPETIQQLKDGVYFEDGKYYVTSLRTIRSQGKSTHLEIELRQGRNREIRRLFARLEHKVMHLERVTFGPVKLGRLGLGKYRPVRDVELQELRDLVARTGDVEPRPRKKNYRKTAPRRVNPHAANAEATTTGSAPNKSAAKRKRPTSDARAAAQNRRAVFDDDDDDEDTRPRGGHPASAGGKTRESSPPRGAAGARKSTKTRRGEDEAGAERKPKVGINRAIQRKKTKEKAAKRAAAAKQSGGKRSKKGGKTAAKSKRPAAKARKRKS